jgi:DNA repair protein RadC
MARRSHSLYQLAIPYGSDAAWKELAGKESQRTPAEAGQELGAAHLLCKVTGMTLNAAEAVLQKAGGLHKLAQLPEHAMCSLPHIGPQEARQIRAMTDWSLLLTSVHEWQAVQVCSPADMANLVLLEMGLLDHEELRVASLDIKNRVVNMSTVSHGSVGMAQFRMAELLRMPVALQCAGMIMLHNHPSGDPTPSPEDVAITELVRECAGKMDIMLLDHLIIGNNRYISLKERGLGFL